MKIHIIFEFDQSDWINLFVDLNTRKWKEARNEFEKYFYQLKSDSVKRLKKIRNSIDVHLVKNKDQPQKSANTLNIESFQIFSENLYLINLSM